MQTRAGVISRFIARIAWIERNDRQSVRRYRTSSESAGQFKSVAVLPYGPPHVRLSIWTDIDIAGKLNCFFFFGGFIYFLLQLEKSKNSKKPLGSACEADRDKFCKQDREPNLVLNTKHLITFLIQVGIIVQIVIVVVPGFNHGRQSLRDI